MFIAGEVQESNDERVLPFVTLSILMFCIFVHDMFQCAIMKLSL